MQTPQIAKQVLHGSGVLTAYHRIRNRQTLTVVMFHRVLPEGDARWSISDPVWTVSANLFRDCLGFFKAHYNIVGLDDVVAAYEHRKRLPARSLLITFDDGWADNEECALTHLKAAGCPAVVFVVAGGIDGRELWDESVRRLYRAGKLPEAHWQTLWSASGGSSYPAYRTPADRRSVEDLIRMMAGLEESERMDLLRGLPADGVGAQLLSTAQLRNLYGNGVAIGSHGLTHTPIPLARDVKRELTVSRTILAERLQPGGKDGILSLSFPHGRFDEVSAGEARRSGYKLLFTSEPHINSVRDGIVVSDVLGRIHIPAEAISDKSGFRAGKLATWLFSREHR